MPTPTERQREAFASDERQHIARLSTQRNPHTDLRGVRRDEIRDHAIDADDGEQHRVGREGDQHDCADSTRRHILVEPSSDGISEGD
jgi:hypothetical protein